MTSFHAKILLLPCPYIYVCNFQGTRIFYVVLCNVHTLTTRMGKSFLN